MIQFIVALVAAIGGTAYLFESVPARTRWAGGVPSTLPANLKIRKHPKGSGGASLVAFACMAGGWVYVAGAVFTLVEAGFGWLWQWRWQIATGVMALAALALAFRLFRRYRRLHPKPAPKKRAAKH